MTPDLIDPWFKILAPLGGGFVVCFVAWLNYRGTRLGYQFKASNPPIPSPQAMQPLAALYVDQRALDDFKRSIDNLTLATEKNALYTARKADEMHELTKELADFRDLIERERKHRIETEERRRRGVSKEQS